MIAATLCLLSLLAANHPEVVDVVTLKSGYTVEGRVEDPAADPIILVMPKGRIALYADMIEKVEMGVVDAAESSPDEPEADAAVAEESDNVQPVINLRPELNSDDDVDKFFGQVNAELQRLILTPEETDPGEEQLQPLYVQALGDLGPRAADKLEDALQSAAPQMGEHLLKALALADPESAAEAAREVAVSHEHPKARETAVLLLGQSDTAQRESVLTQAAKDPVWYVRAAAYREMARSEAPANLTNVAAGLADTDPDVVAQVRGILKEKTGRDLASSEAVEQWLAAQKPIEATVVESR